MKDYERRKTGRNTLGLCRRGTAVLLANGLLLASPLASFAHEPDDIHGSISIVQKGISVKDALEQVGHQSDMLLLYQENVLEKSGTLDMNIIDVPFLQALNLICAQANLTYEVTGRHILIRAAHQQSTHQADVRTIRGQVTDSKGMPLAGATIRVLGSTQQAVANEDGKFSIQMKGEEKELEVAFIGMEKQRIVVKGNSFLHVTLTEDEHQLAEVIVTGYQTISKERSTGAFGVIDTKALENKLQPDLKSVLEGQATGVVLDKDGNIEIRGISTFSAEKTPLIVVDGFPADVTLDDLNPENIENITVLKDGVAASIYGSRAANGVIVITTKLGKEGRPQISYKGILGIVPKPNLNNLHKASSSDYIDAEIDLFNQDPSDPDPMSKYPMSRVTYLLMQARDGHITQEQAMAEIEQLRKVNGLKQVEKYLFRRKFSTQHNVSLSGGNNINRYHIALNLYDAREHFLHTSQNRFLLDLKNQWKPYRFLTINASANISYSKDKAPTATQSDFWSYSSTSYIQPYTNLVDANGNATNIWDVPQYKIDKYESTPGMKDYNYNPINDLGQDGEKTTTFNARLTGSARLDIWQGLNLEVGGNWQRGNSQYKQVRGENSFAVRTTFNDATSISNPANHYFPDGALINESRNISQNWTVRTQLNFRRDFLNEKHRITALVGNEVRRQTYDNNKMASRAGYNAIAGSFVPVNIKDYNAGEYNSDMLLQGTRIINKLEQGEYAYRDNRFVSWYGNASYEYDNRIIVSGSVRLDLTNFFGTDPKYRYKPLWSVGGTYKLSNEKFFTIDWINRLHVRASYGINGNISLNQGPFLILTAGKYNDTTGGVSYSVASPPNNQLRWEKTATVNVGVDMAVLNDRLSLSVDYYRKKSTDLLASDAIDPTTGFTALTRNVGAITNKGVEFSVETSPIRKRHFDWIVNYNFSLNRNTVNAYNVTRNYASSYTGRPIAVTGYPADGLWGYRFAGLNSMGETQVYDAEGNVIQPGNAKPADVVFLGSTRPKFDMSLTNRLRYYDWEFSFMFIAKLGQKYRKDAFVGSNIQNRHVGERWREKGDEAHTIYPSLKSWNMDMFYFPYIDKLVGNASYMKLRDVTLTYNVPQRWTKVIGMSNAKLYFQARNLFRITSSGCDIDPETAEVETSGATGAYTDQGYVSLPLPTEYYIGLSFSF